MAYYNAAAALVFVGKLPHEMDIHRIGRVADVEMHIDVGVELARQLKNASGSDLAHLYRSAGRHL